MILSADVKNDYLVGTKFTDMRNQTRILLYIVIGLSLLYGCSSSPTASTSEVRQQVDTVGFAQFGWQRDSIMARIERLQGDSLARWNDRDISWRMCISPHDDYAYAGWLYPAVLFHVNAPVVLLIGVAHKAKSLQLHNKIVTGNFSAWKGVYGDIPVSPLCDEIFNGMDTALYTRNDTMIAIEHSLEALLPFLQYHNRNIEIIPVLVPYMDFNRMNEISKPFSGAVAKALNAHNLQWGRDVAIVISTDAVHYGDQDWGGMNYATYGTDPQGTLEAKKHEYQIIRQCLTGCILPEKAKLFTRFTVMENDHTTYKWTWCGRYSVPFGLLTGYYLQQNMHADSLQGIRIGYMTSIDHPTLPVKDLGMGLTAPANPHHWVGYAAIGYQ
jgi:MEMO1 family protein